MLWRKYTKFGDLGNKVKVTAYIFQGQIVSFDRIITKFGKNIPMGLWIKYTQFGDLGNKVKVNSYIVQGQIVSFVHSTTKFGTNVPYGLWRKYKNFDDLGNKVKVTACLGNDPEEGSVSTGGSSPDLREIWG